MSDLASFPDEIIEMIGVVHALMVPSSDLMDGEYGTGDIMVDLKRLYARSKLLTELDNLLSGLHAEIGNHLDAVNARIVVLNRMLGQRLGAA